MSSMHARPIAIGETDAGPPGQRLIPTPETVEAQRFVADLREFVADIERLMAQAKGLSGDVVAVALGRLERAVARARHLLGAARATATDETLVARDRAERYVRDDPWTAMAIAAAAGLLFALLMSRR